MLTFTFCNEVFRRKKPVESHEFYVFTTVLFYLILSIFFSSVSSASSLEPSLHSDLFLSIDQDTVQFPGWDTPVKAASTSGNYSIQHIWADKECTKLVVVNSARVQFTGTCHKACSPFEYNGVAAYQTLYCSGTYGIAPGASATTRFFSSDKACDGSIDATVSVPFGCVPIKVQGTYVAFGCEVGKFTESICSDETCAYCYPAQERNTEQCMEILKFPHHKASITCSEEHRSFSEVLRVVMYLMAVGTVVLLGAVGYCILYKRKLVQSYSTVQYNPADVVPNYEQLKAFDREHRLQLLEATLYRIPNVTVPSQGNTKKSKHVSYSDSPLNEFEIEVLNSDTSAAEPQVFDFRIKVMIDFTQALF
eukprot:g76729.t1